MNPLELIAKLTPAQRMDMMEKGFRPGDIKDVKRYINGEKVSLKEKENRAKSLMGDHMDLGQSGEREVYLPADRERISLDEVQGFSKSVAPINRNVKDMVREEMEDHNPVSGKVFNTDDIMSLAKRGNNNSVLNESKTKNLQMIAKEGFENAKEYLNGFIINLQNEDVNKSYNLRLNIFKSLKKCLEAEGKYKNDASSLQAYRQGVIRAEKAMLDKLG